MRGTPFLLAQLFSRLIGSTASLYQHLLFPSTWSAYANDEAYHLLILIFQAANALNIQIGGNYQIPSGTVQADTPATSSAQTLTSHTFDGVIGADDFFDTDNHVVMKDVLDEIIDVTRNVSPTCG
jgi:hypothetical protein